MPKNVISFNGTLTRKQWKMFADISRYLDNNNIKYDYELNTNDTNGDKTLSIYFLVKDRNNNVIRTGTANGYPMITLQSDCKIRLRNKTGYKICTDFNTFTGAFMGAYATF